MSANFKRRPLLQNFFYYDIEYATLLVAALRNLKMAYCQMSRLFEMTLWLFCRVE